MCDQFSFFWDLSRQEEQVVFQTIGALQLVLISVQVRHRRRLLLLQHLLDFAYFDFDWDVAHRSDALLSLMFQPRRAVLDVLQFFLLLFLLFLQSFNHFLDRVRGLVDVQLLLQLVQLRRQLHPLVLLRAQLILRIHQLPFEVLLLVSVVAYVLEYLVFLGQALHVRLLLPVQLLVHHIVFLLDYLLLLIQLLLLADFQLLYFNSLEAFYHLEVL